MDNGKIILCADHAGFKLKEYFEKRLFRDHFDIVDLSGDGNDKDDYPDIISKGAKAISTGEYKKGIFICGVGVGASITANRFKRVRAALVYNKAAAVKSREDNNSNVIVFGGWYINFRKAYRLFKIWWNTEFTREERHIRRINKLDKVGN